MAVNTNGRGEGENTATKKDNPLVSSKSRVSALHKSDKTRQANRHQNRTITNDSYGRKLPSAGKDSAERSELRGYLGSRLTPKGEELALKIRRKSQYHTVTKEGDPQQGGCFFVEEHANPKEDANTLWRPRPRTWKVTIENHGTQRKLMCPCPMTNRFFQPCSHLYSVSDGHVSAEDFGIRWFQDYLLGHLDDALQAECIDPRDIQGGITVSPGMVFDFPHHHDVNSDPDVVSGEDNASALSERDTDGDVVDFDNAQADPASQFESNDASSILPKAQYKEFKVP